jgi:hypothetical protein
VAIGDNVRPMKIVAAAPTAPTDKWRTALVTALLAFSVTACSAPEPAAARRAQTAAEHVRDALYRELQPVTLDNCELERFGEPHDGGYLLCGNLLRTGSSPYSYGISGYDGWGCDVSQRVASPVHQYDCFNVTRPHCAAGQVVFHEECIAATTFEDEGRRFDTLEQQVARNGDQGKPLVVKMDVEGAEWDALIWAPRALLEQVDQLALEFHGVDEGRYLVAVQRLKEIFWVAHLHFNNFVCDAGLAPFPSPAYEVLFVNKRLANMRSDAAPRRPHPLDAPNNPDTADCQY